mmetsp:Transcript_37147/g.80186  ORF Transcript_37147/g.80186 Transcript_37147/m.80186 type:complete len:219 (-) Transcript_37147:211-867(-)
MYPTYLQATMVLLGSIASAAACAFLIIHIHQKPLGCFVLFTTLFNSTSILLSCFSIVTSVNNDINNDGCSVSHVMLWQAVNAILCSCNIAASWYCSFILQRGKGGSSSSSQGSIIFDGGHFARIRYLVGHDPWLSPFCKVTLPIFALCLLGGFVSSVGEGCSSGDDETMSQLANGVIGIGVGYLIFGPCALLHGPFGGGEEDGYDTEEEDDYMEDSVI